jgi:hypothetical protein
MDSYNRPYTKGNDNFMHKTKSWETVANLKMTVKIRRTDFPMLSKGVVKVKVQYNISLISDYFLEELLPNSIKQLVVQFLKNHILSDF